MALRPNPFLERKRRPAAAPVQKTSWFQRARDWTAFLVSLSSLITACIAWRNTLTGPKPFLSQPIADSVTILRSDQFKPGLPMRDENGKQAEFPLLIIQPGLGNRAAPPNGVGVRAIEADFKILKRGSTIFQSPFVWYRLTESSAALDAGDAADHLVFQSAAQAGPFDLPGGATWSKEVLLMPRETWAAISWGAFQTKVTEACSQPNDCQGEVVVHVRLDDGVALAGTCGFAVAKHFLAHIQGVERRFFTSPECAASTGG